MGKLIDADDFYERLLEYAITDDDRRFAEKVKYALSKQPEVSIENETVVCKRICIFMK